MLAHLFPLLSSQSAPAVLPPAGPCARVRVAFARASAVEVATMPTMRRYVARMPLVAVEVGTAVADVEVPGCPS